MTEVDVKVAAETLNITLPITLQTLKKVFRDKVKVCHSDCGGNDNAFIELRKSYELLKPLCSDIEIENKKSTVDGTPLSELGLGFQDNVTNSIDCKDCEAKGYTTYFDGGRAICNRCYGIGSLYHKLVPCRYCKQGLYKQRNGRVVECFRCNGTGKYKLYVKPYHGDFSFYYTMFDRCNEACPKCYGVGFTFVNPEEKYLKCDSCNGRGQIKIYNPVIPKGRLV